MFCKIPLSVSTKDINALCTRNGCQIPMRANEFVNLDEKLPVVELAHFAHDQGFFLAFNEIETAVFKPLSEARKVHVERAAERANANMTQKEVNHLLRPRQRR